MYKKKGSYLPETIEQDESMDFSDIEGSVPGQIRSQEEYDYDTQNQPYNDDLFMGGGSGGYSDFFGANSVTPMEKHSDLLKELTNFNPYIKDKFRGWLGLIWDEEAEKYVPSRFVKPIMNNACASWCVDYLKTYARDNNIITNIDKEEYINLNNDIVEVLWYNLGTRAEEFGIKSDGDIFRVCVELEHAAMLVLMGAGGGKYNQLLSTVTNRSESVNLQGMNNMGGMMMPGIGMGMPQKKQGIFGKMKNFLIGGR